jgi:transposase
MAKPLVSDELWELVEPLIPEVERRYRFPGRKRIDDRKVLTGILYVLPPAPSAAAAAWRPPYHSRRPPPRTARPRHQRPDQPAEAAARLRARHSPLGRRAHALLVAPIPPPARPLQTPRRHPQRVRADRRLPDLPQAPPSRGVILLGALRVQKLSQPSVAGLVRTLRIQFLQRRTGSKRTGG